MKQKTKAKFSWIMILVLVIATMSFKAERKIQMAKFVAPASADALKNPLADRTISVLFN